MPTSRFLILHCHKVHSWLQEQSPDLHVCDDIDVSAVVEKAKNHYALTWHQVDLSRYTPLQPEYVQAPYLSKIKSFKNRKLVSRFRCGCHGVHVDTGRLLPIRQQVPRDQRHCLVCNSGTVEDEHSCTRAGAGAGAVPHPVRAPPHRLFAGCG